MATLPPRIPYKATPFDRSSDKLLKKGRREDPPYEVPASTCQLDRLPVELLRRIVHQSLYDTDSRLGVYAIGLTARRFFPFAKKVLLQNLRISSIHTLHSLLDLLHREQREELSIGDGLNSLEVNVMGITYSIEDDDDGDWERSLDEVISNFTPTKKYELMWHVLGRKDLFCNPSRTEKITSLIFTSDSDLPDVNGIEELDFQIIATRGGYPSLRHLTYSSYDTEATLLALVLSSSLSLTSSTLCLPSLSPSARSRLRSLPKLELLTTLDLRGMQDDDDFYTGTVDDVLPIVCCTPNVRILSVACRQTEIATWIRGIQHLSHLGSLGFDIKPLEDSSLLAITTDLGPLETLSTLSTLSLKIRSEFDHLAVDNILNLLSKAPQISRLEIYSSEFGLGEAKKQECQIAKERVREELEFKGKQVDFGKQDRY